MFATNSYADLSKYVEVNELSLEFEKATMTNRSFFTPPDEEVAGFMNLNFNLDIGDYAYFNNQVLSEYTNRQFRAVAWAPELGFKLFDDGINLYFRHYSGHALDYNIGRGFPEQNAIGIRFNFIKK